MENPETGEQLSRPFQYPESRIEPAIDVYHGREVVDNYRWLEDGDLPDVSQWVADQNELADSFLDATGTVPFFESKILREYTHNRRTTPYKYGDHYFWESRPANSEKYKLVISSDFKDTGLVLIDPEAIEPGENVSLDFWQPSHDGKLLAYGLSKGGDERTVLYVKDTKTGQNYSEAIPGARGSEVEWLKDGAGFFYTRCAEPGTVPVNDEDLYQKLYFHSLGEDFHLDKLIFAEDLEKTNMVYGLDISEDDRYLSFAVSPNFTNNDLFVYDAQEQQIIPIIHGDDALSVAMFKGEHCYVLTNYLAENYRILRKRLDKLEEPDSLWLELISEATNPINQFNLSADELIVDYLVDAKSKPKIFDLDGQYQYDLQIPPIASLVSLVTDTKSTGYFYAIQGYDRPEAIYHHDSGTNIDEPIFAEETNFQTEDISVSEKWIQSKDGTPLPLFVVHKNGLELNGQNPTIVYGYGGFGEALTPYYMRSYMPWVEAGGVLAIGITRGGGEYGESWHRAGIKQNKIASFEDFEAAVEFLIDSGYSNSDKIGIYGASNGGTLVSSVSNRRPELLKAVVSESGIYDIVRSPKFLMALRWVHEFGDPENREEFNYLMNWSPYHTVDPAKNNPATFIYSSENDTRVDNLHARKQAALMQSIKTRNPVLLRTLLDAGHTVDIEKSKLARSFAEIFGFFAWQLGLEIKN